VRYVPICDSETRVFFRSQSGDIGRPSSTSLSPCINNQCYSCAVSIASFLLINN